METKDFFKINRAFFVMDSQSLDSVQTALYGYTILGGAIIEEPAALEDAELTGDGAYVCIRRKGDPSAGTALSPRDPRKN